MAIHPTQIRLDLTDLPEPPLLLQTLQTSFFSLCLCMGGCLPGLEAVKTQELFGGGG